LTRLLAVGSFQPALQEGLSDTVAALRRRDALATVYILVPTHILGRHLMRTIARRRGACFNVRFHTFPELAEVIGIEHLVSSGRIPMSPIADYLLARKAVATKIPEGAYFGPIRDFPSTVRTIQSSVSDLRRAGISARRLVEFARTGGSSKLAELAGVYDEITRLRREAGYFDAVERLDSAAAEAPRSPLLRGALALVLYGFRELNQVERRFLSACLESGIDAYAFVPEDVAGRTRALAGWLVSQGFVEGPAAPHHASAGAPEPGPPARPGPTRVRIISAPGIEREVEAMGREILAYTAAPGASFSDVGILLRHPATYERTIRDVFDAAGIPYVFLDGTPLSTTMAGRLLRLLLRIRLGDYPRRDVLEFLGLARLRPAFLREFPEASAADWERYSREAGIVRGRAHWRRIREVRRRVEWRIGRLRKEAGADGPGGSAAPPGVPALERDARSLAVFEHAVNSLLKRLSSIPDRGTIVALMGRFLRAMLALAELRGGERAAVRAIAAMVDETVADEEASLDAFARLVEDLLDERLPPADVYRSGRVIVSSLAGAVGLPFTLTLIPGLVERAFPAPARQDPVLLDDERAALAEAHATSLATRETQAADEQFGFHHAMASAAEQVVLSYPRLDAATGHLRVPSHFLLEVAEREAGAALDHQGLEARAEWIPVGRLDAGDRPLTSGEWDLAIAQRALNARDGSPLAALPDYERIARGVHAEAARWEDRRFTEYDGLLGVPVPLPPTFSATHLETFGSCPFRFLGERVLGVREIEEPEDVETLTPLDRGALIHDILERFLSGLVRDGLVPYDTARADEYRGRLRQVADDEFRAFEKSGAVGFPFMWRIEQERIQADLEGFLVSELGEDAGYVPAYFEARFGPVIGGRVLPHGSSPRVLELPVGDHILRFTGYIDRIDVHRTGAARVIDYKSGRVRGVKDDLFLGGQTLQLPIYLLGADMMLRDNGQHGRATEAHYYYVTGRGGFRRVRFGRDTLDRRRGEFDTILQTMAESIAGGLFPQNPGDKAEHCEWCPFQPVCGHGRAALVGRKASDRRIGRLRAMWEIE
jgi:ATP-dependent helicase/nuclease subunit B